MNTAKPAEEEIDNTQHKYSQAPMCAHKGVPASKTITADAA